MGSDRRRSGLVLCLLVASGGAFLWLILHTQELGRREAAGRAEAEARRDLSRLVARLPDRVMRPRGEPLGRWRRLAPATQDPRATAPESAALAFAEAEHLELARGETETAARIYADLADKHRDAIGDLAALCAGRLLATADPARARRLLARASEAPSAWDGGGGLPIALHAIYQLARLAPNDPKPQAELARRTEQGALVFLGTGLQPIDLIERLADVKGFVASPGFKQLHTRARMARHIVSLRAGEPQVIQPERWPEMLLLQQHADVLAYPFSALSDPDTDGRARLVPRFGTEAGQAAFVTGLEAPLGAYVAVATPRREAARDTWALWVAFAAYVVGATLAFVSMRRSARAARLKDDFVASVSHEMKTPIASVRAMAELLMRTPDQHERVATYAQRMTSEMERLGNTVRNILDVSRIERQGALAIEPTPTAPHELLERIAATLRPGLEQGGFTFHTSIEPTERRVPIDAESLTGAVMNLIDNAAKFDRDRREITLAGQPTPTGYAIQVTDRGPGFKGETGRRLFRRFTRGRSATVEALPGIGLGLFLVQQVMAAHGGHVEIGTRAGGGARVTLHLVKETG